MSVYDVIAPSFDRHRPIPDAALEAIRAAIFYALGHVSHPRLLDIGAGTGRIGLPFVAAGDDYVGLDLSFGMLRQFADRAKQRSRRLPHLVQADGEHLPFQHAAFDAVMLIQLFGGLRGWRQLLGEARRVLTTAGVVFVGRLVLPESGLDAQMKQYLAFVLSELGVGSEKRNTRQEALRWLEAEADRTDRIVAAAWDVERTPRGFLNRHRTGAFFSALPEPVKEDVLRRLSTWAEATFRSLDRALPERHSFELRVFGFPARGASENE